MAHDRAELRDYMKNNPVQIPAPSKAVVRPSFVRVYFKASVGGCPLEVSCKVRVDDEARARRWVEHQRLSFTRQTNDVGELLREEIYSIG